MDDTSPVPARVKRTFLIGPWIARTAIAAGFSFVILTLARFPYDDAFIHLRIARNLAVHAQPFFNLGERVMADSSPLWMVLIAGLFKILPGSGPSSVAVLECGIATALLLVVEQYLARVSGRSDAIPLIAAAAVSAMTVQASGGLMESGLALLLLTSAGLASCNRRTATAGVLFALAAVARFELCIPAVAAFFLERDKKRMLVGALPVAMLEAALLITVFGTVVPNTIAAKSITFHLTLSEALDGLPSAFGIRAAGAVLFAAAAVLAAAIALRARKELDLASIVPLALLPVALLATYVARHAFVFPWYQPLFTFPAGLAAVAAAMVFPKDRATLVASRWALHMLPCVLWGVAAWGVWSHALDDVRAVHGRDLTLSHDMAINARVLALGKAAADLADRCPQAVLMAPEIGAVGWAFPGRIIDSCALASPEMFPYFRAGDIVQGAYGHIPARAVADFQPDAIIGLQVLFSDVAEKAAQFPELARYRVTARPWFDESFVGFRVPDEGYFDQTLVVATRMPCAARL